MSADSAHAAIEAVFCRKRGTIMDLDDIAAAIMESGCGVTRMEFNDFTRFTSGHSEYKLKKAGNNRPSLKDIAQIEFRRGQ